LGVTRKEDSLIVPVSKAAALIAWVDKLLSYASPHADWL
jgi:hypothetical protein